LVLSFSARHGRRIWAATRVKRSPLRTLYFFLL
jgi:hypothetical protein